MGERYTHKEMAVEAEREVKMRERVYPMQIDQGKLTPTLARRRIEIMVQIAGLLRLLAKEEELL